MGSTCFTPSNPLPNRNGYLIGKIDRDGIANHLVSIVGILIEESEGVWKALYACYFTDRHASIE